MSWQPIGCCGHTVTKQRLFDGKAQWCLAAGRFVVQQQIPARCMTARACFPGAHKSRTRAGAKNLRRTPETPSQGSADDQSDRFTNRHSCEIAKFLQRQLPAVPSDVNVVMDVFGNPVPLQIISAEAPVLTFAYRDSNNFLKFEAPQVDWTQPTKLWRNRIVMKRPVVPVQAEGVPAIVPNSELPAVVPFLGPFNESLVVPRNPTTGPVFIEGTIVPPLYIESPPFYDGSSTIMTVPTQITIEP